MGSGKSRYTSVYPRVMTCGVVCSYRPVSRTWRDRVSTPKEESLTASGMLQSRSLPWSSYHGDWWSGSVVGFHSNTTRKWNLIFLLLATPLKGGFCLLVCDLFTFFLFKKRELQCVTSCWFTSSQCCCLYCNTKINCQGNLIVCLPECFNEAASWVEKWAAKMWKPRIKMGNEILLIMTTTFCNVIVGPLFLLGRSGHAN